MRGELWALQLDPKATFDRLVARNAPSPEARERILGNRISGTIDAYRSNTKDLLLNQALGVCAHRVQMR